MNTGIADVLKEIIREKEIEDILAERGINEILKSQGIPLRKKGEEYSYQMSPNFSLYKNPAEMGVKFESRFADGGIASAVKKIENDRQSLIEEILKKRNLRLEDGSPFPEGMVIGPERTMEFRDINQNKIDDRSEGMYRLRDLISESDVPSGPKSRYKVVKPEEEFADGGIASAITKIKKNPKVEKYAVGALVPIGGAIARAAPTTISRIRQILDSGRKVKDMGKAKVVDDIADAKIVDDVAEETVKRSGNIFTRNPVTTTVGGLLLGAGVAPSLVGGGEEETINEGDGSGDGSGSGGNGGGGGSEPIDLSGVPNETIGVYARKILQQKGFFFNNETGRFEAQLDADGNVIQGTPKFLDYLKAFGSGYLEKTAEDPDFAKKMMAGFAAMTMPKEGPVGFSPLGISEFTQGYLGADIALQEAKPADQKILEYLQQNPDQAGALEDLERARLGLKKGDLEEGREYYESLFSQVAKRDGVSSADAKDFYLVTPDGKPFMESEALKAFKNLSSEDFIKLRDSLKLKSIKN